MHNSRLTTAEIRTGSFASVALLRPSSPAVLWPLVHQYRRALKLMLHSLQQGGGGIVPYLARHLSRSVRRTVTADLCVVLRVFGTRWHLRCIWPMTLDCSSDCRCRKHTCLIVGLKLRHLISFDRLAYTCWSKVIVFISLIAVVLAAELLTRKYETCLQDKSKSCRQIIIKLFEDVWCVTSNS